ncbi:hypothetical protein Tco_1006746 [Tanacetum coccineum]|uniref:Uncharacterized protein n=1 Tax=Tanacetum coccineum TaxID=301880 RepID=A0ABQ5FJY6_9ASTR
MWILLQDTCMTIRQGSLGIRGQKPKRAQDYTYHKEKMLLYKQAEKGVSLQAEQADWLCGHRLLHEKFYNSLGSAPNRGKSKYGQDQVVILQSRGNRLGKLDHVSNRI